MGKTKDHRSNKIKSFLELFDFEDIFNHQLAADEDDGPPD